VTSARPALRVPRALVALILLTAAVPALAVQPNRKDLQDAERARAADMADQQAAQAQALQAAEEERRLAEARAQTAARLQEAEQAVSDASRRLTDLTRRRAEAEARLQARAAAIAPMLPLIERLSLYPTETLLAVPLPPEQAVRGVLVLGGIAKQLERDAAALRAEQDEVISLRAQVEAEIPKLAAAQLEQRQLAAALDAQLAQARAHRQDAEDAAADAARRAAVDAARADSIRTALARMDAERRATEARAREEAAAAERRRQQAEADAARERQEALARPAGPGLGEPRGQLTSPVAGVVVRGFGQETDGGPANGLSYEAPSGARVVSPCGGLVAFAGPFRSYGQLLIMDCGGGWHFVLAGFGRLDVEVGQRLQPGEPVGIMPAEAQATSRGPTLYVELRHDGSPVNPVPYLKARG
jgi:septal ring factor EnvC (AmiA/AmiB activator)